MMPKVYVINLRRRPDRRQRMHRILPPDLDVTFTSDWSGPFDGRNLQPSDLVGYHFFPWQIASANTWWNRPMTTGQIGCALSHLVCWRDAWQHGHEQTLILEDDAAFEDGFWTSLPMALGELEEADPSWDFCFLGRLPMQLDEPVRGRIVRPGFSYCLFAYVLQRSGLEKILSAGFEQALMPVDEFIPALYMEHPRADVREKYRPRLRAYALEPSMVFQVDPPGMDSDTDSSELWEGMAPLESSTPLAAAIRAFEAGSYERTIDVCEAVLANQPGSAEAHHLLGLVAYARGDYGQAEDRLRQAVRLADDVAHFHANLGLLLYDQGRVDEALESQTRALALAPDYGRAHNNLGMLLLDRSDTDAAARELERAVELEPLCAEAHNNLGLALFRLGDITRALTHYRRAISLKPGLIAAHMNLGDALLAGDCPADAANAYESALGCHPDAGLARRLLAVALTRQPTPD